jgi:hypothetical protein
MIFIAPMAATMAALTATRVAQTAALTATTTALSIAQMRHNAERQRKMRQDADDKPDCE